MSTKMSYENLKSFVNMCESPCAVLSVKKNPDGSCGEIIMVATNEKFSMTGEDVEGKPYTEKIPKDPKFEDICFKAAWLGERYIGYVDTTRTYGFWTENITLPLCKDEENNIGYCQFSYSLSKEMDAGKYAIIPPDIASFVIRTCLNLRKEDDFYSAMNVVTKDIREFTDAFSASIMTVTKTLYKFEVVSASVHNNAVSIHEIFDNIPYDVVESWEGLIADTDCIIIRNEEDMVLYEKKAPDWVKTLRANDVHTLCLVPFIHQNTVIGYLFLTNFDVANLSRIKDTVELVSFFLASEASHHLLIERLKHVSNIDSRTGVLNRNAMNNQVDELSIQLRMAPRTFSVAFCYLNTLKNVNVVQGHDAGNNLLQDAGKVLKEVFNGDYVYRSSGDEFAVISTTSSEEEFEEKVNKLKERASDPDWLYFTVGYYTDTSEGKLHTAMRFANEYEREFRDDFYYSHPDIAK
ncbi:GGDEF domain-containing protein [Butyrivibrio proteoclasticus]|uniref:GGDEF domain-containing protein n=1 Tax=Butyrivibrio proteoclasticus TaxID=43305 RepID=UPI00047CA538|nr:diguanylate cyclase [Butyrivibrio proteoclasticus]